MQQLCHPKMEMRISICLITLFLIQGQVLKADAPVAHLTVSGTAVLDPHAAPIRLRGFNVNWWAPPTDQDASDIQHLGANCVRYMFGYNPKGVYEPAQVEEVERQIHYFTSRGIWVIPVVWKFEKPDPADPKKHLGPWNSPEINREFLAMWTDLMARLKNDPYLAAWEPINEPHEAAPAAISAWYRDLVPRLRKIDPARPIVVEGANWSHAEDLTDEFIVDDPNIIYAFHMYYPYNYTTDIQKPPLAYPGQWGKAYLENTIEPAKRFRDRHRVPVWCGEWGTKTEASNYDLWLQDVFAILEHDKFDWCIWSWTLQPHDPQNKSFDVNTQKKEVYRVVADLFRIANSQPGGGSALRDK
jgi:hypothetical protein